METNAPLLTEIRNRLQQVVPELDIELARLESQGALTKQDKRKLKANVTIITKALFDALGHTGYPIEMQKELINGLIDQFETSTLKVLTGAKGRLYSRDRIELRMQEIEKNAISGFGPVVQQWANANTSTIKRLHDDYLHQVWPLLDGQTKDYLLIEERLQEYERMVSRQLKEKASK